MKIINWNIGWPTDAQRAKVLEILDKLNGDIIILTESSTQTNLPVKHKVVPTLVLPKSLDEIDQKPVENRITILTLCPVMATYKTFDSATSVCYEVETPLGPLTLYATILKDPIVHNPAGGSEPAQLDDFNQLFPGKDVCLAGDFNTTFSGAEYPGQASRQALNDVLQYYGLVNVTAAIPDCVDHVAISKRMLADKKIRLEMWNMDKAIGDRIGTAVIID